MFKIELEQAGKVYGSRWLFKELSQIFQAGKSYLITGANGSGKSTLIACLSGFLSLDKGKIRYLETGKIVPRSNIYKYLNLVTPYTDLIEDMTLKEQFEFFKNFKTTDGNYVAFLDFLDLKHAHHKPLKTYSSGMKQKTKLALAFYFQTPILFLDEPLTNLDSENTRWYLKHIQNLNDRLIVIASNNFKAHHFCTSELKLGTA